MLEQSAAQIVRDLEPDAIVLDVGGWASPFPRADWVLDMLPYDTRGLYGYERLASEERFDASTWVTRDICDHEPWPFEDDRFDFAVCSHTLEDLRDPIWVCRELARVARAGYIETPSRLEEQSWGVHGPWVGWSHHRWLVDIDGDRLRFAHKPGDLHHQHHFPGGHAPTLSDEERVVAFWWEGDFDAQELHFFDANALHDYLSAVPGADRLVSHPSSGSRQLGGAFRAAVRRILRSVP